MLWLVLVTVLAGSVVFCVGVVATIYPLRGFGIYTRRRAFHVFLAGGLAVMLGIVIGGMAAPTPTDRDATFVAVAEDQRAAIAAQQAASIAKCDTDPSCVAARLAQTAPAPVPANDFDALQTSVAELLATGVLYRVTMATGEVMVDGDVWRASNVDFKRTLVNLLSRHRDLSAAGLPQVTLVDYQTGRTLADFGVFFGITIY